MSSQIHACIVARDVKNQEPEIKELFLQPNLEITGRGEGKENEESLTSEKAVVRGVATVAVAAAAATELSRSPTSRAAAV